MGIDVIQIEWEGQTGTINADEAFIAAEAIEEHVAIFELAAMAQNMASFKTAKVARAYAALCKVAGINVSAQDVRKKIAASFSDGATAQERGTSFLVQASGVIGPLLQILTDGADLGGDVDEAQAEGNQQAPTS